jgi:hypothetical protein
MFILAYASQLYSSSSSSNHCRGGQSRLLSKPRNGTWPIATDPMLLGGEGQSSSSACEVRPWWPGCAEAVLQSDPRLPGSGFPQPLLYGVDDGLANRVDRIRAIGNGWVPAQAAEAFRLLRARIAQ